MINLRIAINSAFIINHSEFLRTFAAHSAKGMTFFNINTYY